MTHERDYLERTIATVRNHRGADNCWPQWANIFADEIERLWELLGPDWHVYEQREDGWSIKHPLACRDEMLDCPVHHAARTFDQPPVPPGRYRVDLNEAGLLDFIALDEAT